MLDPEAPTYALDVVSVVEATLEDPRPVLGAQEHRARGEAIGEMKADGIEYDERMELLEEVTWPKPLQELLEHTYELYRRGTRGSARTQLSPKSVVRDMYERAMTFGGVRRVLRPDPVRGAGAALPRRRLPGAAPDGARQRAHRRPRGHRRVARRRRAPDRLEPARRVGAAQRPEPPRGPVDPDILPPVPERITANERAFTVLVRNAMFRRVELAALRRWQQLGELEAEARVEHDGGGLARGAGGLLRRARHHRHRAGRARPADAAGGEGRAAPGRSSRSSATRRATTTGGSPPPSTSPPPTTRASWSSTSPGSPARWLSARPPGSSAR